MNNISLIKIVLLLLITINVLSNCNVSPSPKSHAQEMNITEGISVVKNEDEDFEIFIKDFFMRKNFQFDRIIFPVINLIYDTDSEKFDSTQILKRDWKYWNIYNTRKVLLKIIKNKNESILNAQVEETGISVNYVFTLKEGKWFLVKIVDEST